MKYQFFFTALWASHSLAVPLMQGQITPVDSGSSGNMKLVSASASVGGAAPTAASIPSSTPQSSGNSSAPTASPTATPPSTGGGGLFGGVNIAGFDFGCNNQVGCDPTGAATSLVTAGIGAAQMQHFMSKGLNTFRLPVGWEYLSPSSPDTIDPSALATYDKLVQACLSAGAAMCIIDLHNYARYKGGFVGTTGPSTQQYASFWTQIATKYKGVSNIAFELMNEPHDLPYGLDVWAAQVQAAVNAIRQAGATSQHILITGTSWSSAMAFAGAPDAEMGAVQQVTDPAGGTDKLIYSLHQYFDDATGDAGTSAQCDAGSAASWGSKFTNLAAVLAKNGRKAMITEMGAGNNAACAAVICSVLDAIAGNQGSFIGATMWSAGAFDAGSYELSLVPTGGADTLLASQCLIPKLGHA